MSSSRFPDINVWLAILWEDHVHRPAAKAWWASETAELILFTRFTQLGLLRLLTTAAAMNGKPRTMHGAWLAYDQLFSDGRVALLEEPPHVESRFRVQSKDHQASPKLWADLWLLAYAQETGGQIVTFDQALAARSADSILLS